MADSSTCCAFSQLPTRQRTSNVNVPLLFPLFSAAYAAANTPRTYCALPYHFSAAYAAANFSIDGLPDFAVFSAAYAAANNPSVRAVFSLGFSAAYAAANTANPAGPGFYHFSAAYAAANVPRIIYALVSL